MKKCKKIIAMLLVAIMAFSSLQVQAEEPIARPSVASEPAAQATYQVFQAGQRISVRQENKDTYHAGALGNGYFSISGAVSWGFCSQNSKNFWGNGTYKNGYIVEWDNANARKVLYYSPDSEGYSWILGVQGWSSISGQGAAYDMDSATYAMGYLNGDSLAGTRAQQYISIVQGLPDPIQWGYKAFYFYNDDTSCQDIAFLGSGAMGTLDVIKHSSNPDLTNNDSRYSLAGAVYGIYLDDGDFSYPEYTVTLEEYADGWSGLEKGIKYGWANVQVPPGNYYVREITSPKGFSLNQNWYPSASTPITVAANQRVYVYTEDEPAKGELEIIKYSANPEITNNNECYTLAGAVYGVYREGGDYETPDYTITLEEYADGWVTAGLEQGVKYGWGRLTDIPVGKYWVKEIQAPPGFALDPNWYPSYSIAASVEDKRIVTIKVTDLVQMDPVGVLLGKIDAETNSNKPSNSQSLAGAEFTFKFYGVMLEDKNVDPATLGYEPLRTWVFATNENGYCYYHDSFKVSGDELYQSYNGTYSLPIGTLTIQETKEPFGYHINPEVFVRQVTSDGQEENVETYNNPTVLEKPVKMNVIKKTKLEKEYLLPGAEFVHIKPDGTKETMKTDENGKLSFLELQAGEHTVYEKTAPEGFEKNNNVIKFTVDWHSNITFTNLGELDDTVSCRIDEIGDGEVTYFDSMKPIKITINKNDGKGLMLSRAEFTLATDENFENVVAKESTVDGVLTFENLIPGTWYYLKETKAPPGYVIPV